MADDITFTLIGGPTVLVELAGLRFLTDPTFDAPQAYPGAVTLEKRTSPALPIDALGHLDAVLLSHDQHKDNLDLSGRALLDRVPLTLTTQVAESRLGLSAGRAVGLAPWQSHPVTCSDGGRVIVTATPARHGPVGIEPIAGDVVGFALGREREGDAVYVSGDTVWYEGVAEVARRFDPKVVVLFTGSAKTRGSFHLTMDTNDAIEAAHAFPRARIIAVHNEGWAHFTETEDDLARAFKALGLGDRLERLAPGVPLTLSLA
ncbi:MBL fold metallo-hydrolase [Aquabacter sp. L1I39]|uniref:MBL fold metallo-hydrolase n=1 Tax=Aquabacter sp. L1I39 TaxID=2820278 RepID=UPI001ADB6377|nr:MBL fold metallo-hydrolase [Aquabacter sp. L1I39]QTL02493.1 MBL fold metallo-hydrolase [Aquabacter sp. L1I39]